MAMMKIRAASWRSHMRTILPAMEELRSYGGCETELDKPPAECETLLRGEALIRIRWGPIKCNLCNRPTADLRISAEPRSDPFVSSEVGAEKY